MPVRKYPRLKNYDYSKGGLYFITICVQNRKNVLSKIITNNDNPVGWGLAPTAKIQLSRYGEIVEEELMQINNRYSCAVVDNYVIMPNHIHLILHMNGETVEASLHPTVMDIICALKSLVTRKCKEVGYEGKLFQRSFFDRVIRNREEYTEICNYIFLNPQNWQKDELYN